MLNLCLRYRLASCVAGAILTLLPLAENVGAQDLAGEPIPQVNSAQEDGLGGFSPDTYRVLDSDDAETRLMKELIMTLMSESDAVELQVDEGNLSGVAYFDSLQRLTEAQLEFHKESDKQRKLLKRHLAVTRKREALVQEIVEQAGGLTQIDLYRCKSLRIRSELALLRFERAHEKKARE